MKTRTIMEQDTESFAKDEELGYREEPMINTKVEVDIPTMQEELEKDGFV